MALKFRNILQWNLAETEPDHKENLYLAEKFYISEDPNLKYLYEKKPAFSGKKFRSLVFPLLAGYTVLVIE